MLILVKYIVNQLEIITRVTKVVFIWMYPVKVDWTLLKVFDGQNTQVKLNMEELPFAEFDIYNNRRFSIIVIKFEQKKIFFFTLSSSNKYIFDFGKRIHIEIKTWELYQFRLVYCLILVGFDWFKFLVLTVTVVGGLGFSLCS